MKTDIHILTDEEQKEAWAYVCKRELQRPVTNIPMAVKNMMVFIIIIILLSVVTSLFLIHEMPVNRSMALALSFGIYILLGLFVFSKRAIVGMVHLYQHYAPERIRRKCLFKPTCSEYMILAFEKYGLIKGLYKGIYRVVFRCRGFVYSIDYP